MRRSTVLSLPFQWGFPAKTDGTIFGAKSLCQLDIEVNVLCLMLPYIHRHLRKIDWLMACTTRIVCLVSTVSGHYKNALGRGSACWRQMTKIEQSTFLRYLCLDPTSPSSFFAVPFGHQGTQNNDIPHNHAQHNDIPHRDTQHSDIMHNK